MIKHVIRNDRHSLRMEKLSWQLNALESQQIANQPVENSSLDIYSTHFFKKTICSQSKYLITIIYCVLIGNLLQLDCTFSIKFIKF
jgi:hypothetical protein